MEFRKVIALALLGPALALANELPDLGDVSQGALSPVQERKLGEGIMSQIRANVAFR